MRSSTSPYTVSARKALSSDDRPRTYPTATKPKTTTDSTTRIFLVRELIPDPFPRVARPAPRRDSIIHLVGRITEFEWKQRHNVRRGNPFDRIRQEAQLKMQRAGFESSPAFSPWRW